MGLKKTFITSDELNSLKKSIPKSLSFNDKIERLSDKVCARFKIDEIKNSEKMTKILRGMLSIKSDPLELYELFTNEKFQEYVPYEDVFGILYLYFEVCGYPSMGEVKVVAIDEAQDYSLWQFSFIKKIFNRAVFTVLGDKNQSINPYLKYESLEELASIFKDSKYMRLDKSYRSSKEIMEYANRILKIDNVSSVRSNSGFKVIEKQESNLVKDINFDLEQMKSHGYKNLAVITKTSQETLKIKDLLIDKDIKVIPVYQAKGLEYDGVIVYTDKENFYTGEETNLLYVAVTRALHSLVIYNYNSLI